MSVSYPIWKKATIGRQAVSYQKRKARTLCTFASSGVDGALRVATCELRSASSGIGCARRAVASGAFCEQRVRRRSASSGVGCALQAAASTALCEQRRWLRSANSNVDGGDAICE
eukprot:6207614-Pleurochrysis_carterae.AAC.2